VLNVITFCDRDATLLFTSSVYAALGENYFSFYNGIIITLQANNRIDKLYKLVNIYHTQ